METPSAPAARILVVEDEAIVSADIQDRLTTMGYEIAGTTDEGGAAIRLAGELRPDLVLMDVMLRGEMRGTEAARHIYETLKLPVVYLTANADNQTFFKARDTGSFGYVLKPFEDRELQIAIELALYKHRTEQEREALIQKLQEALAQVKTLSGLLPICGFCKRIRDDEGYWNQVEHYVAQHTRASFTHGVCPQCATKQLEDAGIVVPEAIRNLPNQERTIAVVTPPVSGKSDGRQSSGTAPSHKP